MLKCKVSHVETESTTFLGMPYQYNTEDVESSIEITFTNPKCGHTQRHIVGDYSTCYCQSTYCTEKSPKVADLYGRDNQENRVKYYKGKVLVC